MYTGSELIKHKINLSANTLLGENRRSRLRWFYRDVGFMWDLCFLDGWFTVLRLIQTLVNIL